MRLATSDLKPRIGSLVEVDLDTLLSGAIVADIRRLLEQRVVLVIRGIEVDDDQQLAFTRTLGEVGNQGTGEIYKVTFDKDANPIGSNVNYGTFFWHIDRTDTDVPPFASLLSAKRLSPSGGETEFANTYAAHEDLSDVDKAFIDGLKVVHSVESAFRRSMPSYTEAELAQWRRVPKKVHPLVWQHRSGRKSLTLSTSAEAVVGMDKDESDALLARLTAWATRPEYVYMHEWAIGDLIMWNNTGTMHRVRPYDPASGRRLHRTTVLGDEPFDPQRDGVARAATA